MFLVSQGVTAETFMEKDKSLERRPGGAMKRVLADKVLMILLCFPLARIVEAIVKTTDKANPLVVIINRVK